MIKPNNKPYQQCTRCVMDTSDPDIQFDDKGYCNHCTDFFENKLKYTYQGEESDRILDRKIRKIKQDGKNNPYDCVVGISGGADSCYVALICKNLGLRVLLVHLDNGWDSETSVKNIELICRKLDLDYTSYVLDWDDFKEVQLSHLRASIPEIETPTDISILECLHKVAAKNNVKHIIMGGNYITESILPKSWHYDAKDLKYSKSIHKLFSNKKVKSFPSFDYWEEAYYKLFRGIKIFYILNHVPYSKKEAVTALSELGWKDYGQKHHESFYTKIVQSYILPLKFNIDYRRPTLSNKICSGEITRDKALEILQKKPYNEVTLMSDIEYVCKKLSIPTTEFEEIMIRKKRNFKDYPNNEKLLKLIYKIYRYII